jgi:putative ABC transport system permease protein
MKGTLSDLASLIGVGLRGLRSRLLLTVGSVLLAAIAVAAAVVGPMYQSASAASYVVTRLRAEPNFVTGLTVDYAPEAPVNSAQAGRRAVRAIDPAAVTEFRAPERSLWARRLPIATWSTPGPPLATLLAEPGICSRLVVTGRCPTSAGQMLMLESDAAYTHTHLGDLVEVDGVSRPLRVVGTYRLPTTGAGWFNTARFTSVLSQPTQDGYTPYFPAPFVVVPSTVTGLGPGQWFVRMDYRLLVPPSTTLDDLRQAAHEVSRLPTLVASYHAFGSLTLEPGNALRSVVGEADARSQTAEQTVTPAVVSLILVALVLLGRLLSAAMGLRQPELALASLRGMGRRQLWVLGIFEPVLMLAVATPVGVALGYLAGRLLAAAWLVPGLPVEFETTSVWFAVGVLTASLGVAVLTVRAATAEPLSVQISNVRRPTRSGRWVVLIRLTLIAAAVAMLGGTLWSGHRSKPDTVDLLLPVLLAVAAGLLASLGAATAARWWAGRSARRRGVAGYVASRTIARRREGTLVVLPLTAALAIAVFAAGIYQTAASWRASDAATIVGADTAFQVRFPLSQAVALTHRLDPNGNWLMAVGANSDINGSKVIVDAPRLPRVAVWPSSWTPGVSVRDVARELSPVRPTLTLVGRRIQMTVSNRVSGDHATVLVSVDISAPSGKASHIYLGPYPHGQSTASASMPCRSGCEVTGLSVSAPTTNGETMQGTLTISQVRVDGTPMPYATGIGWRGIADPTFVYGAPSVENTQVAGSTLTVQLDSHGRPVVAMLTPRDVPPVLPVLMGRAARPHVVASHGDDLTVATSVGANAHVHSVGTTESMPVLGPAAMLVDDTMYFRANLIFDADTKVSILARSDTPRNILEELAAHGITQRTTLQQVRHTLDQDPYALALNLYLVVTVIVILLACAGLAANMAIQIPARRRDAASLRVVGLRRRSIVTSVASEFAVVLGAAAVAGILAGALSQYVVVRTVTLGYADTLLTPRVLPSLNLTAVAALLAVALAVLLCLAVLLGALTIRGARTATLREDL